MLADCSRLSPISAHDELHGALYRLTHEAFVEEGPEGFVLGPKVTSEARRSIAAANTAESRTLPVRKQLDIRRTSVSAIKGIRQRRNGAGAQSSPASTLATPVQITSAITTVAKRRWSRRRKANAPSA